MFITFSTHSALSRLTISFIPSSGNIFLLEVHLFKIFFSKGMLISRRRQWHPTPVLSPEKSHGWRSLVGCSPWDREESDTTELIHFHFSLSCIGEVHHALQCSCLENSRDGGAWWAAVYEVAQSRTWLKRLSSSSGIIERNFQRVEWLQSFIHNKRLRNNFSYFSLVAAVLALLRASYISKVIK